MEGVYTVHPGMKFGARNYPTLADLIKIAKKEDKASNIFVYNAESDEYHPVEVIFRATKDNGVLDEDHIILAIKFLNDDGTTSR